ncbi:Sip1-related alpha-galactosidase [Paenibacillus roseipurpureus]|uniref:Sip1-related alpha-galactosidase n=1 Tax=Paenibacillus roseopurpureus TaxID=2918901 RepID=A0AA96LN59_9BACL|nr:Sip1-related alpha-galactosidase [Paenibacillus sp. MBLB1832]WNR42909.1 Sip1-related alpha-galactosidase [Paenibacillus sp. MBLB1832]
MLKVSNEQSGLRLLNGSGRSVLEGLRPQLGLDRDEEPELELSDTKSSKGVDSQGGYEETIMVYSGLKGAIEFTIRVKSYEGWSAIYVGFQSTWEMVGGKSHTLLAEKGIRLLAAELPEANGLMAIHLYKDWWTRPAFIKPASELPTRTQALLWQTSDTYNYLLPVCADAFKTALSGNAEGFDITISAYEGGYSNVETLAFILAEGDNPFLLSDNAASAGLRLLGRGGGTRENRKFPEVLNKLGWCSWDAFYYEVSAEGLLAKAEEMKQLGLPIGWFIIDAGWSDDHDYALRSFEAQPAKFPQGLEPVIRKLKTEFGIKEVGVWHTLIGYWNGIEPGSRLALEMAASLRKTNCGKLIPKPDAQFAFRFWDKWHAQLKTQGVDFVKVDYQSVLINLLAYQGSIGHAASEAHKALEASVGLHFGGQLINCMGMASENVWSRPSSGLSRNSEDFFPKDSKGFHEHALQNAYNAFFHGAFYWTDWDMFWSHHTHAVHNAVLRAVSGGPVYVSDAVGATKAQTLWPLILSSGRILRCDQPGLPTRDCLLANPHEDKIPLKVWNRSGQSGVLAAFNIHLAGEDVRGTVSVNDISGLEGDKFAVYEHFSQELRILTRDDGIAIHLQEGELQLYIVTPLLHGFAAIGLADKYISSAAVLSMTHSADRSTVVLEEGGPFVFASERAPKQVTVNHTPVEITYTRGAYRLAGTVESAHDRSLITIAW